MNRSDVRNTRAPGRNRRRRPQRDRTRVINPPMALTSRPSHARVNGAKLGFPAQKVVHLAYTKVGQLASTAGALNTQQFKLNSLFDPDQTGVGSQPLTFDQWMLFYTHYVVMKCSWSIEVVTSLNTPMVGFYVSDDTNIPTVGSHMIELGSQVGLASSTAVVVPFTGSVSLPEYFRRPRAGLLSDSTLRGDSTASPTELVIGNLWLQHPDLSTNTEVSYIVSLTFEAVFQEPKDLVAS